MRGRLLFLAPFAISPLALLAAPQLRLDLFESDYQVGNNNTYTQVQKVIETPLTYAGIMQMQWPALVPLWSPSSVAQQPVNFHPPQTGFTNLTMSFYPQSQRIKLLGAFVRQKNGRVTKLNWNDYNIGPAPGEALAPGFDSQQAGIVYWPQLFVGDSAHVAWQFTQFKDMPYAAFSVTEAPTFVDEEKLRRIVIRYPKNKKMYYASRGYKVTKHEQNGEIVLQAELKNYPAHRLEKFMVNPKTFEPYFLASSMSPYQQLQMNWHYIKPTLQYDNPMVQKLVHHIVGDSKGIEAIKKLYNWDAKNVFYVAIQRNVYEGSIPNTTTTILKNMFGDCKDHASLLAAMIQAIGIKAYPAFVDWSGNFAHYKDNLGELVTDHFLTYVPKYHLILNPTDTSQVFGYLDNALLGKDVYVASPDPKVIHIKDVKPSVNQYVNKETAEFEVGKNKQGYDQLRAKGQNQMKIVGSVDNARIRRRLTYVKDYNDIADSLLSGNNIQGAAVMRPANLGDLEAPLTIKARWHGITAQGLNDRFITSLPTGVDYFSPSYENNLLTMAKRRYPLWTQSMTLNWLVAVKPAQGYRFTNLPKAVQIDNPMASYQAQYKLRKEDGAILLKRRFVIKHTVIPAKQYPEFRKVLLAALADQQHQVVMQKG